MLFLTQVAAIGISKAALQTLTKIRYPYLLDTPLIGRSGLCLEECDETFHETVTA